MLKTMNYYWRLFATGLSFTVFGIGGFLLWVVFFPLLSLLPGTAKEKKRRAQRSIHYSFYFFIGLMHRIGIMSYETSGLEKLNRPGQLILANHPTLIDIVFLISRIPTVNCIVKQALLHNPFTKGPIINAGYISNGVSEQMIKQCVEGLIAGEGLIIFPEGTRTGPEREYKFQRGAAHIALQAKSLVTPVIISCSPSTLSKNEKWYQIPPRRFHLKVEVRDDIVLDEFLAIEPHTIAVRRFNRYLEDYFRQNTERLD